jgi:PelA/Pel-15E family pectate lyase
MRTFACLPIALAIALTTWSGTAGAQGVRSLEPLLDKPDAWFTTKEAAEVVDTLLLYQRSVGGWPKNIDMGAAVAPAKRAGIEDEKDLNDATIDNGATYTQIRILARFVTAAHDAQATKAALDGIDYLLRAQYPNGGWPQYFPLRSNYSHNITFNDGAMIGVMRLLAEVGAGAAPFAFVDEPRRAKTRDAVARGLRVILASQIVVNGKRTVWCAQHDPETLGPAGARKYEHPSLSGSESVGIVEYLMDLPAPSPEVVAAIEGSVTWFRSVRIEGIRLERRPVADAPRGSDLFVVPDPAAPPLWARFYEIGTNRPIFSGRDAVVRYSLAEIEHERRNGYSWYGEYAKDLLATKYPAWKRAR